MNSFKFRIAAVSLLLFAGLVSTAWSQSQTPAKIPAGDGAATSQVTGKEVTLTLVRWPYT